MPPGPLSAVASCGTAVPPLLLPGLAREACCEPRQPGTAMCPVGLCCWVLCCWTCCPSALRLSCAVLYMLACLSKHCTESSAESSGLTSAGQRRVHMLPPRSLLGEGPAAVPCCALRLGADGLLGNRARADPVVSRLEHVPFLGLRAPGFSLRLGLLRSTHTPACNVRGCKARIMAPCHGLRVCSLALVLQVYSAVGVDSGRRCLDGLVPRPVCVRPLTFCHSVLLYASYDSQASVGPVLCKVLICFLL